MDKLISFVERRPLAFAVLAVVVLAGFTVMVFYVHALVAVSTLPARVVTKTLETNNVIQSYEWFYDVQASYLARSGQIAEFKGHPASEDPGEANRERIELSAVRQTCRELATKYNANSQKMNKSVFKGWSLPEALSVSACQ